MTWPMNGWPTRIVVSLVILVVTWFLSRILAAAIRRLGTTWHESRRAVIGLAATTAKVGILLVGIITAIGTLGIDVSALVAGLGLTGFALGFALKDALSNLLAGVLVLIYQPFAEDDTIAVAGSEGRVREINLRYTVVEKEGVLFQVPNALLLNNVIRVMGKKPAAPSESPSGSS